MSNNTCEHCNLFLLMEEKRINWCDELGKKNIELLEKINKQQEIITNIQKRLIDRNKIITINNCSIIANYFEQLLIKIGNSNGNGIQKTEIAYQIKDSLKKFENRIEQFSIQQAKFENVLLEKENEYSLIVLFLKEMAGYYRDSLFEEMKEYHRLKSFFTVESKQLEIKNNTIRDNVAVGNRNVELCTKYKALIKQNQADLKTKETLIDKLRSDRKMLYLRISKTKQEVENKEESLKHEIQHLKTKICQWKEKYEKLQNRKK